jgi:hypothetical protein
MLLACRAGKKTHWRNRSQDISLLDESTFVWGNGSKEQASAFASVGDVQG